MMRPLYATTNAAVRRSGGSKAASMLAASLTASISGGNGASGRRSPIGQGCVAGSGSDEVTFTGVKNTERAPRGNAMQPWSPKRFALRLTPFGERQVHGRIVAVDDGPWSRRCASARGDTKKPSSSMAACQIAPGDEQRRAQHLGIACGHVLQWIARRNLPAGRQLVGAGRVADLLESDCRYQCACEQQRMPHRNTKHRTPVGGTRQL